jgi:hypothetical protein
MKRSLSPPLLDGSLLAGEAKPTDIGFRSDNPGVIQAGIVEE